MPTYTTIPAQGVTTKDPGDSRSFCFDWDLTNLAPTVQISTSTFTISELNPSATWSALVAYVVDDQVVSGGTMYLCILAHTNHVPPNSTYWTAIGVSIPLTKDNEARLTAAQANTALELPTASRGVITVDNRVTRLRLIGGTLGQTYDIANTITSSETPPQIKERHFSVLVEH